MRAGDADEKDALTALRKVPPESSMVGGFCVLLLFPDCKPPYCRRGPVYFVQ